MELELSLMGGSSRIGAVRELLRDFEQRSSTHIGVTYQGWDNAWAGLVRSSLYGKAPAVSEVGTSWVPDLVGMNALYPLPNSIKKELGTRADFIPQSWDSCFLSGNPQLWAVPWISGTRIIYYRKDLLARAGLNSEEAFASLPSMLETLSRLAEVGVDCPWVTSTTASINTLHLISSWVWNTGGDFISQNGRQLLFTEDRALNAMGLFFQMARYLGPESSEISYEDAINRFWSGSAAVTIDGSWLYAMQKLIANPLVLENIGFAPLPAPAFVGGSNLVIWTNTLDKEAALKLMLFMSEQEAVLSICRLTGLAPARHGLTSLAEGGDAEFQSAINRAFETGRSLPNLMFSAMLEDKLRHGFGEIWTDILNSPHTDPREIIICHMLPLKARVERIINS